MRCDWSVVPLGEVLRCRKEFVHIDDLSSYKRCRVQLHAKGIVLRDVVPGSEIKTKEQQVCRAGELLVAEIDAKVGGFGIVPEELGGAIVSSHYFLFQIKHAVLDRQFLGYFIGTPDFRDQVSAQGSTNYAAIRPNHVLEYKIPLPPLDEQRRIVARIERLAAKIEKARGLRREALAGLDDMLQSAAAVSFDGIDGRFFPIEELCEVRGGVQKSSARLPGANPRRYITVAHVHRGWVDTNDPRYFEVTNPELERWRLLPGDVLVIEGNGSADQIGRAALFRGEIVDCVHQNHVIRVRPNRERLMPEYLNAYLNSANGQSQVLERSRTTSGLFNLSVGRVKSIEVPLPGLSEQRRLVAHLDNVRAKMDGVSRLQAQTAAELDALLPSVLDKAFKGQL